MLKNPVQYRVQYGQVQIRLTSPWATDNTCSILQFDDVFSGMVG